MKARTATKTPLIGRVPDVRGGDAVILGTRISVLDIVRWVQVEYEELGFRCPGEPMPRLTQLLADEKKKGPILGWILANFRHLTSAQVLGAWQYFLDHEDEILGLIAEEDAAWRAHE